MNHKLAFPLRLNRSTFYWIAASILIYLFFLSLYLPASVVISKLSLPPGVSLYGISGTVWSGKAERLSVRGVQAGSVKWELSPWSLLLLKPAASISILNGRQFFLSRVSVSSSGKMELHDTRFNIALSTLQPLIYGMPFAYEGQAAGFFADIYFYRDHFIGINGKLTLTGLKLVSPQQQHLGDYVAAFQQEKAGATSIRITSTQAELDIDAQVMLEKNGLAKVIAQMTVAKAGNHIDKMIAMLGKKDSRGRVMLRQQFKLW